MFISNYYKNSLVNVDHIVRVYLAEPQFEQRDWRVYADMAFGYGSETMCRGSKQLCVTYLKNFWLLKEVQNDG